MTSLTYKSWNPFPILFTCVALLLTTASCGRWDEFGECGGSRGDPYAPASIALAAHSSWMEVTEYTVTDIKHAELSDAEAQYALDFYHDDPPFLLEATPGKVWRGTEINRLFVRSSVGRDARKALKRGSTVLIGAYPLIQPYRPIAHGEVIEFRSDNTVMMLGSCAGHIAKEFQRYLDSASPVPELEAYGEGAIGLARALAEGNENVTMKFDQWTWSYWAQEKYNRTYEDTATIRPLHPDLTSAELFDRLEASVWTLDVENPLQGSQNWLICPRSEEGWSPCISLPIHAPYSSIPAEFYHLPGESRVEFWLVPGYSDLTRATDMVAAVDDFTDGAQISVVINQFDGTHRPPVISADAHIMR